MKTILGLDLGTNSIGWALLQQDEEIRQGKIIAAGSRIIPMDQGLLGDFGKGNSVSQTADRTHFRGVRRIRERSLLRRERIHRVLNLLGFLPPHYAAEIDFDIHPGQFRNYAEPKINHIYTDKFEFLFQSSFEEMVQDFAKENPEWVSDGKKIPYDWTLYYLRKKALTDKISKEELAWIILNFNQKRGYYQLRGEEDEDNQANKLVEYHSLKVVDVIDSGNRRGNDIWYDVILENGWKYRKPSRVVPDWIGKTKDFIVTTTIDKNGNVEKDKYGEEKRSFRAPAEDDWTLKKKKTEKDIENSGETIGSYIYSSLLNNPAQKIKGKLVKTIERKFYKNELKQILSKQKEFHPELKSRELYNKCIEELYPHNDNHRQSIHDKDFTYLFIEDIIFYQRPLKSKKSEIATCQLEYRCFHDKEDNIRRQPIRCIPKSHPLFQEFRLWQFIHNLRIYKRQAVVNGKLETDYNVTDILLPHEEDRQELFDWLNGKKEIKQDTFLKYPKFGLKKDISNYRWNYVEDKSYPCNETHALISSNLQKAGIQEISQEDEFNLWHLLYSVDDKQELIKSLNSFAIKRSLPESFVEVFRKFPSFEKEYGAYSAKAIGRLLPLMRMGKYWSPDAIDSRTLERINKIMDGEVDESISNQVRDKSIQLQKLEDFKGLPLWLASYIVYNRHAEAGEIIRWKTPHDLEAYLHEFKQHSLKNPVVEQVIMETLRVVKDIWNEYGNGETDFFDEIHIELGREMKSTAEARERMARQNQKNENTNLRIRTLLAEFKELGDIENVRPYSPNQMEIFKIFEEDILNSGIDIPEDIQKISKMPQPSKSEIIRYKLWLEQKYCSPYTGNLIPLSKLFTPEYEIEHIIPQSRYFDNSFNNKVICEAAVNKEKGNKLGYEFIKSCTGKIIDCGFTNSAKVFSCTEYEEFIKSRYSGNLNKMKKLLMEDIPETFIARQQNDTRYISRHIQYILSALVRTDDEQGLTSTRIVPGNGRITTELKQQWGLNDVWNDIITPRFERLNRITNSNAYGQWTNKAGKNVFQIQVPMEISKGFSKKRIDHRHHAMDAIVVACTTRNHVNYFNNESSGNEKKRYDLKAQLFNKKQLIKPWDTFTQDAKEVLSSIIVSFKQNLRVINKTVNTYRKWEKDSHGICHRILAKQEKGDSWAIRKPMHKETIYGRISIQTKKQVNLPFALDDWKSIADKSLKMKIKGLIKQYGKYDKKTILKYFKDRKCLLDGKDISKVDIYQYTNDNAVSRAALDEKFDSKRIKSISDTGIQKILFKHLSNYNEIKGDRVIEHPELAFSADGLDELNKNIIALNDGKYHKPIYRVRTYEPIGNKFMVGTYGNKNKKYVEAAKGTNLFFGIYQDDDGKRYYETIPLNVVIERQKQGLPSVPERNEKGIGLLFSLSPNDLVYVPTEDERESGIIDWNDKKRIGERVYKMVSSSGNQCFFVPGIIATPIISPIELGANNKAEKAWSGEMIKERGIKININRIGLKL